MRKVFYTLGGVAAFVSLFLGGTEDKVRAALPPPPAIAEQEKDVISSAPLSVEPLRAPKDQKPRTETLYVTATSLRMRSGPGTDFNHIGSFAQGAAITYAGESQGNWRKVVAANGQHGWMHKDYLSNQTAEPVVARAAPANFARPVDDRALKQRIIKSSLARYSGNCPCPYNRDSAGRRCGARSAYSRPGGASPICYESDITAAMLARWR